MKCLPNELLAQIYSYLSTDDVANLPFHITSRVLLKNDFKQAFNHLLVTLEIKPLEQLVRISTNPSLCGLVTKITISTRRTGFVDVAGFLERAWKEHVRRQNKIFTLAAAKGQRNLAPGSRKTSKLPANLQVTLNNFHQLIGVVESECYYCHALPLRMQYICAKDKYHEWEAWHLRRQDISTLTFALRRLQNLRQVNIDHEMSNKSREASHQVAATSLGSPQFFIRPPYNECPTMWSRKDLYEVLVQALWPLEEAGGISEIRKYVSPCCYLGDALYLMISNKLHVIASEILGKALFTKGDLKMTTIRNVHNMLVYRGTISASSLGTCVPIEMRPGSLQGFVRSMARLHGLTLGTSDDDGPSAISIRMCYVLESNISFGLSVLDLTGYWIRQSTMAACLKAAAPTLRSLRLHRMALALGNWASLFDELGDRFRLEALSLRLRDYERNLVDFSEEDIQDVLDWLCGRSDFHSVRMMEAQWADVN